MKTSTDSPISLCKTAKLNVGMSVIICPKSEKIGEIREKSENLTGKTKKNTILRLQKSVNPLSFDMWLDDHHSNLRKQYNSCHKNSPVCPLQMLKSGIYGHFAE